MNEVQFIPADWFKYFYANPSCRLTSFAVRIERRVNMIDRRRAIGKALAALRRAA